jgi:hypothetical protein
MKKHLIVIAIALMLPASTALAHCDWINGPVVADARTALAKGAITPVLRWIPASSEAEIRDAFQRTLAARSANDQTRDVADQWFFETVVRIHRASEGEPFTGLKGADYQPDAGIEIADHAIEANSLTNVEATLTTAIRSELRKRFSEVIEAKKHADESVEAGRHFVHAYAEFIHYVDEVHRSVHGAAEHANADDHD